MHTLDSIARLDKSDKLAPLRDEFILSNDTVYLDGNSLGALTKRAKKRIESVVEDQWGRDLIHSWNKHNWIDLPMRVGNKIAALIGADYGQVIACDSTSVNLFKVLASALAINSERSIILSQNDNFPTDLYMAQGLSALLGASKCELKSVDEDELINNLDESIAVLMLTHVNFRSGRIHDMQNVTAQAQAKGILVVWDLAHSAGALELELDNCRVDFAVGCGYKYLNGGPGAPAFIYAAKRHQSLISQPLSGWMGHQSPFKFEHDYRPANGMHRFLSGTPNIISMVGLDASLDVFSLCSIADIRAKSIALSELFISLIEHSQILESFTLESPRDSSQRGSQLALSHDKAFALSQALIDQKVIVDFREPNIIRFGFTPLYCRFIDVYKTVNTLEDIVDNRLFEMAQYSQRSKVT